MSEFLECSWPKFYSVLARLDFPRPVAYRFDVEPVAMYDRVGYGGTLSTLRPVATRLLIFVWLSGCHMASNFRRCITGWGLCWLLQATQHPEDLAERISAALEAQRLKAEEAAQAEGEFALPPPTPQQPRRSPALQVQTPSPPPPSRKRKDRGNWC